MNEEEASLHIFPWIYGKLITFGDYPHPRKKTHHLAVKNPSFITAAQRRRGQKEEEKRRKKMIAEKNHKRKPSVKIAPETLQNCNGFLLLKLIGVAML